MWIFYALAGPIALGMVTATLQYFAASTVPLHVRLIVGYAWFCTISVIILVPADIWTTVSSQGSIETIKTLWSWSYWSTFCLTWAIVPTLQGYEDAGDFTVSKRIKTGIQGNLVLYASVGVVSMIGVLIMIFMRKLEWNGVLALAINCSNTFGLVTGAFLLGYGLVEVPRSMWRDADLQYRQKYLTHQIAKVAVKLDDAHQELSTAIVIAQATSNQMSRHDPLRRCMDVIDQMMSQMVKEDPVFKPSGGRMGESDMDYDSDEKSMAALRRRLRKARSDYYRFKSDYSGYVWEALELEETMKNCERGSTSDGRFISTIRPTRMGPFAIFLDKSEYVWRCLLRQHVVKILAGMLAVMSAAIVMAEATLSFEADLSLFSVLLKTIGQVEMLVQVVAFIPLAYMCVCTYFSLIKLGMMTIYYLAPKQTGSVSLLMICSMVARYAAPLCYNFLNLIRLRDADGAKVDTIFEKKMGTMTVVTFMSRFNQIYPIFMVIYTGLLASNVLKRVMDSFGSWHTFRSNDQENTEGFDPSGLIILRKERTWLERGGIVGENVVPLARNFGNPDMDIEADINFTKKNPPETNSLQSKSRMSNGQPPTAEGGGTRTLGRGEHTSSKESIAAKYAALREPSKQASVTLSRSLTSNAPALIDMHSAPSNVPSNQMDLTDGSFAMRWDNMKSGLQTFSTKRFAPLRQDRDIAVPQPSSQQTLDSIFQGLRSKQEPSEDEDGPDLRLLR